MIETEGRVTAVHKERYDVECPGLGLTHARLKSAVYHNTPGAVYPTAGDRVSLLWNDSGDSIITATLPRKSSFTRRDPSPGRGEQAVAANFDYVFILTSLNREFNIRRLERYLTLAWQSGGIPVVILTKVDLAGDDSAAMISEARACAAGADVHAVSAVTGFGLDGLAQYLRPGATLVFLGSSGVGKSSLVNALAGERVMDVNGIREDDARGRHTTTYRQLITLGCGASVIDTPGMRELGMWDVTRGLGEAFGDVDVLLGKCRFSDCTHRNEPGCAIRQAITDGRLDPERWESYIKLKSEARYSDDKEAYLRAVRVRGKEIAKKIKQIKQDNRK